MKYLFYPIAILFLALTCTEFFPVLMYACKHIAVYQWLLYGMEHILSSEGLIFSLVMSSECKQHLMRPRMLLLA